MTTGDREAREARYGRRRGLSDAQRYALIGVALALGTLLAYVVFRNSEQAVQSANVDFQVLSTRQVVVSYEVDKPAAWTVTCVIRARNADGAEVGRQTITVPAGKKVVRDHYTLATTDRANTGEIQDCARAGSG